MYHDYALVDVLTIKKVSTGEKKIYYYQSSVTQKAKSGRRTEFMKLEGKPIICPELIRDWSHQLSFLQF